MTPEKSISDERLVTLIAYAEQTSKSWISVEVVAALRELQQRRSGNSGE